MSNYVTRFYGVELEQPMSQVHGTDKWENSRIGRLHAESDKNIFIREVPVNNRAANYAWRVVDAFFSNEDSVMTYFQAFGPKAEPLPHATFGVNWNGSPHRISGGFAYPPEFGNKYYVPAQNNFHTPNTGGYTVQVLDLNFPSEGLSFGLVKRKQSHQALIVRFRLLPLMDVYPQS